MYVFFSGGCCHHNCQVHGVIGQPHNINEDIYQKHQQPYDTIDMARKLQDRLKSLKNQSSKSEKSPVPSSFRRKVSAFGGQPQQQLDDISVNSSVSCRAAPLLDDPEDGENDTHPCCLPSAAAKGNNNIARTTGLNARNSSFTSLQYSLPANLDTRATNSSLASREDLQCSWAAESRQTRIATHDYDPLTLIDPGYH